MTTIYDLNEDCLSNIFKYLTIYELIEVEKVCELFKDTCDVVYKSKVYHRMRLELRYMRPLFFGDIFDRIGGNLRHFEFSGGYIMDEGLKLKLINGVINKCPKLQNLIINYIQLTKENLLNLSTCFNRLTCLDLSRCGLDEDNMAGILDGDNLRNFTTLNVIGNTMIQGNFLVNMKHLKNLDISYCFDLRYTEFIKFLKNCTKLIQLDISACVQLLEGDIIGDLLNLQPHLEKLHFQYAGIPQDDDRYLLFKSMKDFKIHGYRFGT
ncbi:unnamed protein product [Diamesa hyperborea]